MQNSFSISACDLSQLHSTQLLIPNKLVAVCAPQTVAHPLVLQLLAERAMVGPGAGVIFGDNHFDDRLLTRQAKESGFDPERVVDHVSLTRAETCHDVLLRIEMVEPEILREWALLCVSGLLKCFYDEAVEYYEAEHLLTRSLKHLREIADTGLPVLISVSPPRKPGREDFLQLVADAADLYWQHVEPVPELPPAPLLALLQEGGA